MLKTLLLALLGVAVLVGGITFTKLDQFAAMGEAAENMVLPPETVTAMQVTATQWEQTLSAPATLTPVQGVEVSAETGGRVSRIAFQSGDTVNAGDVLVELDSSREQADLAAAEAAADLARIGLTRVRKLSKQKLASQDELDSARAGVKEANARAQSVRALIAKKTIRAPFSGRLGLRLVNLGQILHEGDAVVSLQTLDPIYVDFSIPQNALPRLDVGLQVRVSVDAAPDTNYSGSITAINPDVDIATRSIRVRATIENPDGLLRAGMFADVTVVLPEAKAVLPVVETAIAYATFGDSVFVIEAQQDAAGDGSEKVLRQQFVQLGERRGDYVDIIDGLNAGDTVVTSGVFKLRSDARVVIDNTLAPAASLAPNPSDS